MTVGSIGLDFDLVGVGRAMIAEPDWPKLVRKGELDRLKPFSVKSLGEALMAHVAEAEERDSKTLATGK